MRAVSRLGAVVVMAILLSLSALGADEKDKKAEPKKDEGGNKPTVQKPDAKKPNVKKDADKAKEKPAKTTIKVGEVVGKVAWLDGAKKALRVQVKDAYNKNVDAQWEATDDVKVRMLNPPPQFDDKGRPKKYTRKELRELKGNDKLPGFPAEFSDIKQGQYVQVTLVRKKGAPRKTKGDAADPSGEYSPHMSLIVIIMSEAKN